jgi:hypothetical protein
MLFKMFSAHAPGFARIRPSSIDELSLLCAKPSVVSCIVCASLRRHVRTHSVLRHACRRPGGIDAKQ